LPGLQAFIKACKSVDYPRVTPAAFFPCRGGMEKVHLLSGPNGVVDLIFRHRGDRVNLLRHAATVISRT